MHCIASYLTTLHKPPFIYFLPFIFKCSVSLIHSACQLSQLGRKRKGVSGLDTWDALKVVFFLKSEKTYDNISQ